VATGHGGNLRELAQRAGLNQDDVLDFSASVNPLGPPESLRATIARGIDRLVHYPDPDCSELVDRLARRFGASPEEIVVGNGSTEVFFALARAMPFDRAVIPVPSYIDYATAVQAAGREVVSLKLSDHQEGRHSCLPGTDQAGAETDRNVCPPDDPEFAVDFPQLEQQLRGNELVLLGQPNNPTGRPLDVEAFCSLTARHPDTLFVVDEAFADFIRDYRSLAHRRLPNVVVVRSLTKFYAIPGLRVGYVVAPASIAAQIKKQILPWSVGTLAQDAALAVLADDDYARRSVELVERQRLQLAKELGNLPGVRVYPSVTNFLLARLNRDDVTAPELAERLLRQGIAIRTFTPEQHLDQRYFRVAVRTEAENLRLCDAIGTTLTGFPCRRRLQTPMALSQDLESATGVASYNPTLRRRTNRRTPSVMLQGTSSNAGKSVLTAALCRILLQDGVRVAPFKSQNMSLNSFVARNGEMGRAQVVQAQACRLEPDVRMNPILLKPCSDTGCQVIVRGEPVGNMSVADYVRYKPQAFAAAKQCYESLAAEFDAIILEGAGSPGEVNLKSHDIVNMPMAAFADAPVLVVGDIDRGGVFASFVGTMEVLAAWERKLIAGWLVNRFRGDASLLGPALDYTLAHTGRPVLGVVPYLPDLGLPQEDSVEFKSGALDRPDSDEPGVEIAVVDLPHISNFTDFDAFTVERDVRLRIIRSPADLNSPDAVVIPGSKNTLGDLDYLRRSGLAERIAALARQDKAEIVGLCGGLQMLGREIRDPLGIESAAESSAGLDLLAVNTVMAAEKTLVRTSAKHTPSGLEVTGYEIHHGMTDGDGGGFRQGSSACPNATARKPPPSPCGDAADCRPLLTRADGHVVGVASRNGRVWGTYLHGVFDADPFRRWFVDRLRERRGLAPLGDVTGCYDIEPVLDRLAQVVRESVRIDEVYRIMGLR
jgi:adenosylcobyric acid synthase